MSKVDSLTKTDSPVKAPEQAEQIQGEKPQENKGRRTAQKRSAITANLQEGNKQGDGEMEGRPRTRSSTRGVPLSTPAPMKKGKKSAQSGTKVSRGGSKKDVGKEEKEEEPPKNNLNNEGVGEKEEEKMEISETKVEADCAQEHTKNVKKVVKEVQNGISEVEIKGNAEKVAHNVEAKAAEAAPYAEAKSAPPVVSSKTVVASAAIVAPAADVASASDVATATAVVATAVNVAPSAIVASAAIVAPATTTLEPDTKAEDEATE